MSEPFPVPDNGGAAFFGFMGVSLALVLASKDPIIRLWSSLRNCQGRNRYQQHLHLETQRRHEVAHPSRHGRYLGYLRHDRGCHHHPERYSSHDPVKANNEYLMKNGFSHMASGLVCGFSCVVHLFRFRRPATQSERWVTLVSEPTPSNKGCLLA